MRNIDSYDSRYPLEYYEIGTIYSFYCSLIAGKFKKQTLNIYQNTLPSCP